MLVVLVLVVLLLAPCLRVEAAQQQERCRMATSGRSERNVFLRQGYQSLLGEIMCNHVSGFREPSALSFSKAQGYHVLTEDAG